MRDLLHHYINIEKNKGIYFKIKFQVKEIKELTLESCPVSVR